MAEACGITVIKEFPYRGAPEEWSNQYWFTGGAPATPAAWTSLFDALAALERLLYMSDVKIVRAYGYDEDTPNAPAVWVHDISTAPLVGSLTPAVGMQVGPGDSSAWLKWFTGRMSVKGKAIYLRKYFHPAYFDEAQPDRVHPNWITAAQGVGNTLCDGSFIAGRVITAQGHADLSDFPQPATYVTTRTLRRRGKRPPLAQTAA